MLRQHSSITLLINELLDYTLSHSHYGHGLMSCCDEVQVIPIMVMGSGNSRPLCVYLDLFGRNCLRFLYHAQLS